MSIKLPILPATDVRSPDESPPASSRDVPRSGGKKPPLRQQVRDGLLLLAFAVVPAAAIQFTAAPPGERRLHVEAFRYGKDPSVIRCNRGDLLYLTFSTRDTGHSFFLEEFDIDAKITPASDRVAVFSTSRPQQRPVMQREVAIRAEHPGWLRYLVSKSLYRCHVWCGPMHAFEHGNLVIWPNTLLAAGLGLLVGLPVVGGLRLRPVMQSGRLDHYGVSPTDGWDLFQRFPWLKRLLKWREFALLWMLLGGLGLYLVILTSLFGTHVAGRNFGVMMTWVVWMFLLTVVLTPFGGRVWCMACPLPVIGDVLQRRTLIGIRTGTTAGYHNRFYGLNRSWPKWLANDWPRRWPPCSSCGRFAATFVRSRGLSASTRGTPSWRCGSPALRSAATARCTLARRGAPRGGPARSGSVRPP